MSSWLEAGRVFIGGGVSAKESHMSHCVCWESLCELLNLKLLG